MYQSKPEVISLGDSKQATLYFDRVVIVDPVEQMGVMGLPGQLNEGAYQLLFGEVARRLVIWSIYPAPLVQQRLVCSRAKVK